MYCKLYLEFYKLVQKIKQQVSERERDTGEQLQCTIRRATHRLGSCRNILEIPRNTLKIVEILWKFLEIL
jgi:hypothetical protein